jgi:V8-like Glu-specific endopeptidase
MHRKSLLAAFAVASLLGGCSVQGTEEVQVGVSDGLTPRIVGGTRSTVAQDSVVYLSMGGEYCTGTLIAPNLVLTARHCVQTMDESSECGTFLKDNKPSSMSVALGYGAMTAQSVAVGARFFHETNTSGCSYDIALVQLDRDIPNATIASVRFTPVTKGEGSMTAVGYGSINDSNGDPAGRLQRSGLSVQGAASTSYDYSTKKGKTIRVTVSPGEFATGESTCFGDSGGPLFDAMGNIVGVTSRGIDQYCIDRPSIWSDTASHLKLITDAAASVGYPLSVAEDTTDANAGTDPATSSGESPSAPSSAGSTGSNGTGSNGGHAAPSSSAPSGGSTGDTSSESTGGCNYGGVGSGGADDLVMVAAVLFGVALLRARRKSDEESESL